MSRKPDLTEAQQLFLQQYKEQGAACTSAEFADRVRRPRNTLYQWRRNEKFRDKLLELEERNLQRVPDGDDIAFPTEGLEPWMVAYLKEYQISMDGHRSRGLAKVTFEEVYDAQRDHEAFAKQLRLIEEEHIQRARDSLKQQAILKGVTSAVGKYLEAESDTYRKKVSHDHKVSGGIAISAPARESARLTWADWNKRLLPAKHEDEVVEAEIVEATG